ncbi:MAG TPA: YdcF family protein [Pyrinomonadaceae bacterium]|jgi:uncharacterized SAM-binding protein YcdF (DUF218 family)
MSRIFKILTGFLLLLIIWATGAPFLAKNLIIEKPLEKADAIVVLAGAHTYVERTQKAAELFRTGAAPKIYLTDDGEQAGWSSAEQRNPLFVELARNSLIANGVAAENIEILEPQVSGTIYEARRLSEKVKSADLKSILIVTSAYHTRRALSTFERVFAENNQPVELGIAAPPVGIQTPRLAVWWLSRFGWQIVAGEYVKSIGYWVYY